MNQMIECDIAIIGAGSGGLSVAAVAAQLNLNVVLIEANKMGGDCLNTGCVPSKALIAAAKSRHQSLNAKKFGIETSDAIVHFDQVMQHVHNVIKTIAPNDSVERFTELGAKVIMGPATFVDEKTVLANDTLIRARRFIIASGSSPQVPPIPGLENIKFLTNESIFELQTQPSHLIVIGCGPIGCELAQAFSFLGTKVTMLEAFKMMPRDEPDLVNLLREKFNAEGLVLHEEIKVLEVKQNNQSVEVTIEKNGKKELISGSHLLVAAGRKANVADLNLEKAKVEFTPKGIKTDKHLRTSNKKIYAIGDVVGPYQFTHMANYHAGIAIKNIIFKTSASLDYQSVPWVTYTSPELAHVGLTEAEALKQMPTAKVFSSEFTHNDRAQAEGETYGKIKVVVTPKGKILGVSILGEHAGELILPWVMLIKNKKSLRDITDTIVPYPTLNDISKHVASKFYKPILFSNTVRRLVNFLKHF